jgi:hypothetical protein
MQDLWLEQGRWNTRHGPGRIELDLSPDRHKSCRYFPICVERHSRTMISRVDLWTVRKFVMFLLRDCCNGQPELCAFLSNTVAKATRLEAMTCRAAGGATHQGTEQCALASMEWVASDGWP